MSDATVRTCLSHLSVSHLSVLMFGTRFPCMSDAYSKDLSVSHLSVSHLSVLMFGTRFPCMSDAYSKDLSVSHLSVSHLSVLRFGTRFPCMSDAYSKDLRRLAGQICSELGCCGFLREGVYCMVTVAKHCGLRVLGLSLITNMNTPLTAGGAVYTDAPIVKDSDRKCCCYFRKRLTEKLTANRDVGSKCVRTERHAEAGVAMTTSEASEDELRRLDVHLDRKSRLLNLTPLNWSLSAVNKIWMRTRQMKSIVPMMKRRRRTQLRRIHQSSQPRRLADQRTEEPLQRSSGQVTPPGSPHLLTAPESSFLERLNAVEEELDCSPAFSYNQSPDRKACEDGAGRPGLAYRTRSKLRLVNVPLEQLEAELLAPDITADMYDQSAAQREEDRHWTRWLQGLMTPQPEEEADDDDDPEYNVLEDLDEPDLEDYRTDRAVQITKKEVNELLEELFDTVSSGTSDRLVLSSGTSDRLVLSSGTSDRLVLSSGRTDSLVLSSGTSDPSGSGDIRPVWFWVQEHQTRLVLSSGRTDPSGSEFRDIRPTGAKFNVPAALRFEAPLASMLTERRRTVRKQYEALQQRRALQDSTNQHRDLKGPPSPQPTTSIIVLQRGVCPPLHLDHTQKLQLQQQIQQHVQLLTQVHLLTRRVDALNHENCITKHYLEELQQFARRREELLLSSSFRGCNLQGALDLLQEQTAGPGPGPPASSRRWLPTMSPATRNEAWLFATRPVFLYPELLPVCSLDPPAQTRRRRSVYTAGEDGLMVLALKHFEGGVQPDQLISSYLLCKSRWNLRKHIREMSGTRAPPHSAFLSQRVVPPLPLACSRAQPGEQRPPVERDTSILTNWLKNSQLIIQKTRLPSGCYPPSLPPGCSLRLHPHWLNKSGHAPPPPQRRLFALAHNASLLPLAKAPAARQPISSQLRPPAVGPPPPSSAALSLAAAHTLPAPTIQPCLPIGQTTQQSILLPLPSLTSPETTNPRMPCSAAKSGYLLLQMVWTPPTKTSQNTPGPIREDRQDGGESGESSASTLSPVSSCSDKGEEGGGNGEDGGGEEEDERGNGEDDEERQRENGGGEEEEVQGEDEAGGGGNEEEEGQREAGGGEEEEGQGEDGGGEGEEEEEQKEDGGGEEEDGDKDKDEDQDRQGGEEEEEEDFDDLTQDEDEEEVMSSASEESVLSVPELQETMKQLTWLAGSRQVSKDSKKLLLLYDENLLSLDPQRESKDMAFAQGYLQRVREALQDVPGQVEEFVSLLNDFEQVGEGQEVMLLFRKLRCILGDRTDLLRDFAAFLHPEQALQCGLFEEQQAFERSRRFLRQLEISFGDNPSHYQKIIKALQTGPDLSPSSIHELKAQMAALLKGHTHLQAEFWVFFDELRPPPARPAQFEEAHWPEEGGGGPDCGEGVGILFGGGACSGFEEVTLPELEEEEEGLKMQPMTSRRQRRKMDAHRNYKDCDWSDNRRHHRKGCLHCHGNKAPGGVSRAMKRLDPLYAQISPAHLHPGDKDLKGDDSPPPGHSSASWEGAFPLI
ncbi:hypothetical protein KUDE01_020791, partial [Dissostichus eleginoides]